MPNDAKRATTEALPESAHLARLHFLHSEMLAQTEAHSTHVARREDKMIAASPIMTLFREFEVKYRQAGDMSFEEEIASGLLDECNSIEKRIMALPVSSEQDLAAKLIVNTRYGNFVPGDIGTGGLLDQALSILAVRQHPDAELLELAAERNRLVELRNPLREKANGLAIKAKDQWIAKGNLSRDENIDAYEAHCAEIGLLDAEDEREAIDGQIYPLDDKIRAIPAQTVAGLKVKFDLLRNYLPVDYVDEEPREDQDFDVCLLNELGGEINRLAEASKPAPTSDSPIMTLVGHPEHVSRDHMGKGGES